MKGILAGRWRGRDLAVAAAVTAAVSASLPGGPWPRRMAGMCVGGALPGAVAVAVARRPGRERAGAWPDRRTAGSSSSVCSAGVADITPRCSPADVVTFLRAGLVGFALASALTPATLRDGRRTWRVAAPAMAGLALDAVDGRVARRTGTASAAGARLDMETDAAALLGLSLVVARVGMPWALLVGAARYLFVGGGLVRPSWTGELPPGRYRRPVAGLQAVAFATALTPCVPVRAGRGITGVAAGALAASFGRDIAQLERRAAARRASGPVVGVVA